MSRWIRYTSALVVALCLTVPAHAQPKFPGDPGQFVSGIGSQIGKQVVLAAVGAGVVVIAIVSAVAIHISNGRLNGCVSKGPDGFLLTEREPATVWELTGDTGGLKAGERMKLKGKQKKAAHKGGKLFLIQSVARDYGPCQ